MKFLSYKLRFLPHVFCLFSFSLFLFPFLVHADDTDPDLDAANRAYSYGSYDEAVRHFQSVIDSHGYSASLCFNLGNAEAKDGHLGLAILNYERARYLAPDDREIDHNLQLARKQAGLDPNSYRWWQIMLRSINWTFWFGLIITCLTLLALALIATAYAAGLASALKIPLPTLRVTCKAIFFICIPLTLLFGFVELSVIGFSYRIEGVVVATKQATLRLSPFDSADSIGTIPEGELVTVEDKHNDYYRIEARDHHFGWIQQKDLQPVVAGSFDTKP